MTSSKNPVREFIEILRRIRTGHENLKVSSGIPGFIPGTGERGLGGASAAASLGELGYNVKVFCIQDSPRRAHSIAATVLGVKRTLSRSPPS